MNANLTAVPGHPHSEADEIHEQRALGFWLYLMGDAVIFALLFATYAIMIPGTAGGPTGKDLFDLNFQHATRKLANTSELADKRKELARILTAKNQPTV